MTGRFRWFILAGGVAVAVLVMVSAFAFFGPEIVGNVAVIPIKGKLTLFGEASGQFAPLDSGGASAKRISDAIKKADENPSVSVIVLEINSPGGTVIASKDISDAVRTAKKPVVAWLRETAASGAYWVAASADWIVADPATLTGSIGVTSSYLELAGLLENYGVAYRSLTFGRYKDAASPFKKLESEERALMQSKINKIGEMFVDHIAQARKMDRDRAKSLATGELLLGVEAKELGLVDELGGETEVKAAAKRLGKLKQAELFKVETEENGLAVLKEFFKGQAYWFGRGFGEALGVGLDIYSEHTLVA